MKQASDSEQQIQHGNLPPGNQLNAWRYAGHCLLQAAYQSANEAEFEERIWKASGAFQRGAALAKETRDEKGAAWAARFSGLEQYCLAQLATENSTILEHLYQAFSAFIQAWQVKRDQTTILFPCLPLEIISTSNNLFSYEAKANLRLQTVQTTLQTTEPPEDILTSLSGDLRILFLTELCRLHEHAWLSLPDYEQREKAGKRAIELMEHIRPLVQESADPRILVAAFALQTFSSWLLPEDSPIISGETLISRIQASGDRVAIGTQDSINSRRRMYDLGTTEDPEKARKTLEAAEEEAARALTELNAFRGLRSFVNSVGFVYWTRGDLLAVYARLFADSLEEKRRFIRESVEVSRQVAENAPPLGIRGQYSNLGFYIYELALLEQDTEKRRKTLEEAYAMGLKYEEFTRLYAPYWEFGDAEHYLVYGRIKRELARISKGDRQKQLEDAVLMYQKTADCVKRVIASNLVTEPEAKNRYLAQTNYELGITQVELYQQSRDKQTLDSALKSLHQSAEAASNLALPTRAGEALTRVAEALLLADRFEEAAKSFREASQRYRDAAKHYPGLTELFNARAQFIEARSKMTEALAAYQREAYNQAATHYRQAADLLRTTSLWSGLAPVYDAWALLAEAEEQNIQDTAKAITTIEAAVRLYSETEKTLKAQTLKDQSIDPQTLRAQSNLLEQGRGYAEARLLLEHSRELQHSGKLAESAEKLEEAATRLQELATKATDPQSQDFLRAQAILCRASQAMLQAEYAHNPELYVQAAALFQEAQGASRNRSLVNSAGGWAACCRALELGIRYRQSGEKTLFEALKKQAALAHGYFVEAGATSSADWVMATQRMFDAMAYLAEAEASLKPEERKTLYEEAEQHLRTAAELFERAGFTSRREDAMRQLKAMLESKATLSRLLPTPPVVQSVSVIAPQAITQELIMEDELTSALPLQAALRTPEGPLRVGHETELPLTVLNTGQRLALLERVEGLQCSGLEIRGSADEFHLIDGNLQLHEKRLSPLEAWQLPLIVLPRRTGEYTLTPRIIFKNPQGEHYTQSIPTLILEATEMGLRGWLKGSTQ